MAIENPEKNVARALPWTVALLAIAPLAVLSRSAYDSYTFGLWVTSALFLGLPHGASDWLLFKRLAVSPSRRACAGFIIGYCCLASAFYVLWIQASFFAASTFVLITVWHWGSADSEALLSSKPHWFLSSLLRGAFVMSAPFVYHPALANQFFQKLSGAGGTPFPCPLPYGSALLFGVAILYLCVWGDAYRTGRCTGRSFIWQCAETLLLLGLFALLPPLVTVGVYFLCVHSMRHSLRLCQRGICGRAPSLFTRMLMLHSQSFLFVLPIWLILVLWVAVAPEDFASLESSIASYLKIIAALTLPHALLVLYFDLQTKPARGACNLES